MSNACTSKQTRYTGGFRVLSATHLRDLLPPPCGKICHCFQTFWHILVVWYVDYVDLLTMAMAVLDISELSTVLPPRCRKDGDWQTPGSVTEKWWCHVSKLRRLVTEKSVRRLWIDVKHHTLEFFLWLWRSLSMSWRKTAWRWTKCIYLNDCVKPRPHSLDSSKISKTSGMKHIAQSIEKCGWYP